MKCPPFEGERGRGGRGKEEGIFLVLATLAILNILTVPEQQTALVAIVD